MLARLIHRNSARSGRVFVAVNCAALAPTLIESELFGHEKGAFTGAAAQHVGRFERAHGGTLFLDEIADLDLNLQTKLLRVLQERSFERVGGTRLITVDVRILAATNRDLKGRVAEGKFREDLYQRLSGLTLLIPPLRERSEELPALIAAELKAAGLKEGKNITAIHPEAMVKLLRHAWPGNLRELNHTVRTMTLFCNGSVILPDHVVFPPDLAAPERALFENDNCVSPFVTNNNDNNSATNDFSLATALKRHVRFVYDQANHNQRRAAKLLGISRSTLARYLREAAPN